MAVGKGSTRGQKYVGAVKLAGSLDAFERPLAKCSQYTKLWPLRILGSSRSGEEKWAIYMNEGPYICSRVAITDRRCAIDVQSTGDKIRFGHVRDQPRSIFS